MVPRFLGNLQDFHYPAQNLAIVYANRERPEVQFLEHAVDHRRHLRVVTHGELILTDHVDIALIELAEASALRALAAVDALNLIAPKRKTQFMLMLGDVARQRDGKVEPQSQFRYVASLDPAVLGLTHNLESIFKHASR